jgi:FkbM family methyltransferase
VGSVQIAKINDAVIGKSAMIVGLDNPILNLVGQHMVDTGQMHEQKFLHWFRNKVRQECDNQQGVLFDIGANIGTFSVFMCHAFPYIEIYAFEPIKELFEILTANIRTLNLMYPNCRITAFNNAIGNVNETLAIVQVHGNQAQSHILPAGTNPESLIYPHSITTCAMLRLDEVVSKIDLDHKRVYVKIDVEGFEAFVIHGMPSLLLNYKPVLLIENNSIGDVEVCFRLLTELKLDDSEYRAYRITNVIRVDDNSENYMVVYEAI